MDSSFYDLELLEKSEAFRNHSEMVQFLIMEMIEEHQDAMGAWELQSRLQNMGVDLSTATTGRYLKELDAGDLTEKFSNKGRVLTEKGRKVLADKLAVVTSDSLHQSMRDVMNQSSYRDLRDIYVVRMAIEIESVKLCCRNITDEEMDKLLPYVEEYNDLPSKKEDFTDVSLDFHLVISAAGKNRFLDALLKVLIHEQKKIEKRFQYLETRDHGRQYAKEHEEIYQCIRNRDEERAMTVMKAHFENIMSTVEEIIQSQENGQ